MALSHLIPWSRGRDVERVRRDENPFGALQREMNRVFEDLWRGFDLAPFESAGSYAPRLDVSETEEEVRITAEMPGLEEKDFELSVTGDQLLLRGEKREERESKGEAYHRLERAYGSFQRVVELPCEVEADKAKASYHQGVLSVTLPKAPSARRASRKIPVNAG